MSSFTRVWFSLARSTSFSVPKLSTSSKCWPSIPFPSRMRLCTTDTSVSFLECSRLQLQNYKNQERYFKRKIREAHRCFSEVPDNIVVQGQRHIYFEEGGNIYRMSRGQGDGDVEEVLCTRSSADGPSTLQRVRLSPGERTLAATVKTPGNEEYQCILVRLGQPPQPLLLLDKVFSFEWASDDILFFTTMENLQCRRVFRLDLSATRQRNLLVYEEQDPEFFVEVSSTRDKALVTLNCSSKSSSEVWLIDSNAPTMHPKLVQTRRPGLLYHVEHSGGNLYILANTAPGQEYQLLSTPLHSPSMRNWEAVFTPAGGTGLQDMELLQDHCILTVRTPGGPLGLQVVPLDDPTKVFALRLPSWACALEARPDLVTSGGTFRFLLSSPVVPPAQFLYSPRERQLFLQDDNAGPPPLEHHTTCLEALSQDGTMVPLTVLHASAWDDLRGAPLLLHVYGAYGLNIHMGFSPEKRLLLEDGWVLAYCHVRGGGERGLHWHQAGRLEGKLRGMEDLAACIRRLFDLGVSCPPLTALTARSAGAVLAGALCNQHPDLLRAVSLQAPFLDVLGTMQDPTLPLTVEERGEWGDPLADPRQWESIASYCPCLNIRPQRYPSMLLTAYQDDRRVPLAGVLRYAQRLRDAVYSHANSLPQHESETLPSIILDLQPGGDHFGPEDFSLALNESARQLAFLYRELGVEWGGPRRKRG